MSDHGMFFAGDYDPAQVGAHPVGMYDATIEYTSIHPTKSGEGEYFAIDYKTDEGTIRQRFNLWNNSEQAMAISNRQLSAVCHACGVFRVDMNNEGLALRGARLKIEIAPQRGNEHYVEIKRVLCMDGKLPQRKGGASGPRSSGNRSPSRPPAPAAQQDDDVPF